MRVQMPPPVPPSAEAPPRAQRSEPYASEPARPTAFSGPSINLSASPAQPPSAEPSSVPTSPEAPPSAEATSGVIAMGSNDPHQLRCADKAPSSRRGPTFDPIAHLPAEVAELRRRPLPANNVAPVTEPLEPPTQPEGTPPFVTRLEQIIPRPTIRRVRRWWRQLRRSLKFASQGNFQMARRLRPADLWLPHEHHSVPATAAWDWDCRPLARGEPAIPLAPSDGDKVRPAGPMGDDEVRAAIHAAAVGFADQAIVSEILQGIRDDATCARGTLLCAPHTGALRHYEQAREKLLKSESKGWASTESDIPCWPIRASPYSIVDESKPGLPKWRLTNDLSWPHHGMMEDGRGGFVESVNGSMDRGRWPRNALPKAAQSGEAAAILQSSGAPVKVWGLDCEAYYRSFGRQRAELARNAIAMLEGAQLDERCCFGSAADAVKCSRASNLMAHVIRQALQAIDRKYPPRDPAVLAWLEERKAAAAACGCSPAETRERFTALHALSVYIDDATGASINDLIFDEDGEPVMLNGVQRRRSELHFEAAIMALERIGHASSPGKEQPPSDSVEALGLEIDIDLQRMRLLVYKRKSYAKHIERTLEGTTTDREDLISLLSKLIFAASCLPRGRPWLNAAWRQSRAAFRLAGDRVKLSSRSRQGLQRWREALLSEMEDGVPLAHGAFPACGEDGCSAVYADASGKDGWAAWTLKGDEVLLTYGEWSEDELADESFIIAEKELLASTLGLVTLAPVAGLQFVYSFTDNTNAEAAMRRLTPRTPRMQSLIQRRFEWMAAKDIFEAVERICSKANLWADLGSRRAAQEVVRQAQGLGLRVRIVDPPAEWRSTTAWRAQGD